MGLDELKKRRHEDTERLRQRMKKDWMEIVRDKLKDVAALFGIKFTEDAKVRSHRIRR